MLYISFRSNAGNPTHRVVVFGEMPSGKPPFTMVRLRAASFAGDITNDGKLNPAVLVDPEDTQLFSRSSQNASRLELDGQSYMVNAPSPGVRELLITIFMF